MDLDVSHLRSFEAIVRYGGYHRAADALHLTQPGVSRHIRRLEEQLGEPLFAKRGRGVELTPFGERAAEELIELLHAHDRAVARLRRPGPFVFGTIENLVDPLLPDLFAVIREQVGELLLRVDRSFALIERMRRGELDAAIVIDPRDEPGAIELGPITLRWWTSAAVPDAAPLPLVAYDPPCGLRDLALARLAELGLDYELKAESPHLSGIHAAVRNGLGCALLAAGADGLRAIGSGPLAEPITATLHLLLAPGREALAQPLRAALWRATVKQAA